MTKIFKCKTSDAYQIKVMSELLLNNFMTGCFEITKKGIFLRMFDESKAILIDLELLAENFSVYKFKSDKDLCLGLHLKHFHGRLKSIKRKDSVQFHIDEKTPNNLCIRSIPKDNTSISESNIKIQNIQNLDPELPKGYGKPIVISSSDFKKIHKELSPIRSSNIVAKAKNSYIEFRANADDILDQKITMGDTHEEDSDSDDDSDNENYTYQGTFESEHIYRISKIAGLNSGTMQIYVGSEKLPLLIKSNIGNLGKISVYIESKEMNKYLDEKYGNESDYDSDSDLE